MVYKLPVVSQELSDQVDKWYARSLRLNFRYVDMLFSNYMKQNQLLLLPIENAPEEVVPYTKDVILTTIRKLDKQAKLEGRKLPRVKKETLDSFQKNIATGKHDDSLQLALRYAEENEPLCRSVVAYSQHIEPLLRQHLQYPFIYTLALLENQGTVEIN